MKIYETALLEIFIESNNTYGPDRICGVLRRTGFTASYKGVSRIMQKLGLSSVHNRRRQRSLTDSNKAKGKEWPNLIRGLKTFKPFQVITSDISYIKTAEGFEYLCKVKDIAIGIVLAHTMDDNMRATLVTETIQKAKNRWDLPEGCIHHSDLGAQYTANKTQELLTQLRFQQSFSRIGKPGDNAMSESIFSILKKESVHWRNFQTRKKARKQSLHISMVFITRVAYKNVLAILAYSNGWSITQNRFWVVLLNECPEVLTSHMPLLRQVT